MRALSFAAAFSALALAACDHSEDEIQSNGSTAAGTHKFKTEVIAEFDEPWAMTFLRGAPWLLVTEKRGTMKIVETQTGRVGTVSGMPKVAYGGQGGLGDVVIHPTDKRMVYLSYAEAGEGGLSGAAVARGRMDCPEHYRCTVSDLQVIWRQSPKVEGQGHYGHRLAFGPDGKLYISNGDRQKFDPAQDMNQTLGKIVRLNDDGSVPSDNPFANRGGVTAQIWTLGHRNPLGLAFAPDGTLWSHEMGPKNGDEFNLIERGSNYGYPIVSNGDHYNGTPIPDHDTRPEFNAPEITWNGVSPAGLIFYTGDKFPGWRGNAFLGGLSGQTLVRVVVDGNTAREAERWDMGARVREVEQGPDGAIWVLEDERGGSGGRLLRLTPEG